MTRFGLGLVLGFIAFWAWTLLFLSTLVHLSIPAAAGFRTAFGLSPDSTVGLIHTFDLFAAALVGVPAGIVLSPMGQRIRALPLVFFVVGFAIAAWVNEVLLLESTPSWAIFGPPWMWGFIVAVSVGYLFAYVFHHRAHAP